MSLIQRKTNEFFQKIGILGRLIFALGVIGAFMSVSLYIGVTLKPEESLFVQLLAGVLYAILGILVGLWVILMVIYGLLALISWIIKFVIWISTGQWPSRTKEENETTNTTRS